MKETLHCHQLTFLPSPPDDLEKKLLRHKATYIYVKWEILKKLLLLTYNMKNKNQITRNELHCSFLLTS